MKTLYKTILAIVLLVSISLSASAGNKKVKFSCSEPDAKISINGKQMGIGQLEIVIPSYECVIVKVEKNAYLVSVIEFCNKPNFSPPPKTYYCQMEKDDAYDASEATDISNIDIEIRTKQNEVDAWKLISQIITNYFDVIEVTDRETGYLRTSWIVQTFKQRTVRTRMIVKLGSSDPLTYKIKLVSEIANAPQTSVKSDEFFKEWDRVLRKYKEIIHEVQTRLSN